MPQRLPRSPAPVHGFFHRWLGTIRGQFNYPFNDGFSSSLSLWSVLTTPSETYFRSGPMSYAIEWSHICEATRKEKRERETNKMEGLERKEETEGEKGKEERWIHYKRWFREKLEESQLTRRWTLLLLRSTLVFCIRRARSVYIRILSSFVSRFPHFVVLFILPALSFPIQAFLPFSFFFFFLFFLLQRFLFSESCTSVVGPNAEFSPLSANSFPTNV